MTTINPQPRWRRWGKEALWLLLMALVISTLLDLWRNRAQAAAMGQAGRTEVERRFSLQAMVAAYQGLYDQQLAGVIPSLRDH